MRKSLLRKELALGIIMLFILLGSVSNITGKTEKNMNTNSTIILSKNIQTKPLGNFAQRFLQAKIHITIYDNCTFYYQEQKGDGFYNVIIQSELFSEQTPVCKIYCEPTLGEPFEKTYQDYFNCNIIYLITPKTNLIKNEKNNEGYIEGYAVLLILRGQ